MQRERALAEAEGRALENRENEDVNRRALAQRLEEERKKVVEAIDTTFRRVPLALSSQQEAVNADAHADTECVSLRSGCGRMCHFEDNDPPISTGLALLA